MTPTFVAIDFETADYPPDSACAVGLVRVENGEVVETAVRLIRPPRPRMLFTYVHGLTWNDVAGAPLFADVWSEIAGITAGAEFLVAHNAGFDRGVLHACCRTAGISAPDIPFTCSMVLARRTWNVRPTKLSDVCRYLNVPLTHHEALSDAMGAAKIALAAMAMGAELRPMGGRVFA